MKLNLTSLCNFTVATIVAACSPCYSAEDDHPGHSFQDAGWSTSENMGYQARLLLGSDKALLGIVVRVWNVSKDKPIVVTNGMKSPFPFIAVLMDSQHKLLEGGTNQEKPSDHISIAKRTLLPGAEEVHFLPVKYLVPANFDVTKSGTYTMFVQVTMQTDANKKQMDLSTMPFYFDNVSITAKGLATDASAAFKEASKKK